MKQQKKDLSNYRRIRSLTARRSQWRREALQLTAEQPNWMERHRRCVNEITAIEKELTELRGKENRCRERKG